jgi:hypothetical protein
MSTSVYITFGHLSRTVLSSECLPTTSSWSAKSQGLKTVLCRDTFRKALIETA